MKRTWTIIGVANVPASFAWYQSLFGNAERRPAHDYFGQILDDDGTVLLCLHRWGHHDHPSLTSPERAAPATDSCSSSVSTILIRRSSEHAPSPLASKKNPTSTPTHKPASSPSAIPTATTSPSVNSRSKTTQRKI